MQIILGLELDKPVDLVICWTPDAEVVGGTGVGLKLAKSREIPIINLAKKGCLDKLREVFEKEQHA